MLDSPTLPASSLFSFPASSPPQTYTLSLHDALPISPRQRFSTLHRAGAPPSHRVDAVDRRERANQHGSRCALFLGHGIDRKSTRLNSSHVSISYAVFCLKKKKKNNTTNPNHYIPQPT